MKNHTQDGNTILFVAAAALASGAPVLVGDTVAVSVSKVESGEEGVGLVEGVFSLPKVSSNTIEQGAKVYLTSSGSITSSSSGNKYAGKAWAAAGNGDTEVEVKINAG